MDEPIESKTEGDETPDPRIQIELERLNHAAEAINHLDLQLDEAKKTFQEFQDEAEKELAELEQQIGVSVSRAELYYDTLLKLRNAKEVLMKAKHRFERAQALHVAAKELAHASAEYIDEEEQSNRNATAWSETYRHALAQAADAEREKYQADLDQQHAQKVHAEIEIEVDKLLKQYRKSIIKSQPYYEMKVNFDKEYDFQKRKVSGLENCVQEAKSQYEQSMRNLERISNEIHEQRNQNKMKEGQSSSTGEEQKVPSESTKKSNTTKTASSSSTEPRLVSIVPTPKISTDDLLRSCLLRTETLPAGIIAKSADRSSPEDHEEEDAYLNDQFILRSKDAPKSSASNNSSFPNRRSSQQRFSSVSSNTSDTNNYEVDESLHAPPDESLKYSPKIYSKEPTTHRTSNSALPPAILYSLSNPLSKLVLEK